MRRDDEQRFVPSLRPNTLDRAIVRSRLAESFERVAPGLDFRSTLDLGCGQQPWRPHVEARGGGYIGIDMDTYPDSPPPDVRWDGRCLPLKRDAATTILLTEVLEHCPNPVVVLREARRVLTREGTLYFTVPFLWPIHDAPHDEYRFTAFALARLLSASGFTHTDLWALGGWDASLAQMLGLWARRRPMGRTTRRAASLAIYPVARMLLRSDTIPDPNGDGMVTGFAGVASGVASSR